MLNISDKRINDSIDIKKYSALYEVENKESKDVLTRIVIVILIFFIVVMFLPWTQNIQSTGYVTALLPQQRPHAIHALISGRVEKWYVQEGDFVEKGDTILFISEIKNEYLDPDLIKRTKQQLEAKENAVISYSEKIKALDNQIAALERTALLKLKQAENKLEQATLIVISDSTDYTASKINYDIADKQFKRMELLYKEGLKSLTDLEKRNQLLQKARAEMISKQNKLLTSKNKVQNAKFELSSIRAQYNEKIAKARSDRFTAQSNMFKAQESVAKMRNQFTNYTLRNNMYYITAPQSGYIAKAIQSGIGETIKSGEEVVSIMPANHELAVEMYVEPIDLPLIKVGQPVRIQFDGWPVIVFSGWPNVSYGTYKGKVFAIDNLISKNGKYRVLVSQDSDEYPWPKELRVGAGTKNILLLKTVFIWYELWRKTNGFPPDYYIESKTPSNNKSK